MTAPVTRSRTKTPSSTSSGSPSAGACEAKAAKRPSALSSAALDAPPALRNGASPGGREIVTVRCGDAVVSRRATVSSCGSLSAVIPRRSPNATFVPSPLTDASRTPALAAAPSVPSRRLTSAIAFEAMSLR